MKKTRYAAAAAAAVVSAAALALSAGAYNAYIGLQTQNYSFRNSWTEASYGAATPYFNSWIAWGQGDSPEESYPEHEDEFDYDIGGYVMPATYTDAVVEADGTYVVAAEGIDWGLQDEKDFNLIFVSTDIPANLGVKVTDVAVLIDGAVAKTVDEVAYDETAQYIEIDVANIWNPDVGSWGLAFPSESVAIQFTVTGLAGGEVDAAEEEVAEEAAPAEEAPVEEAAPATTGDTTVTVVSAKGSPDTGAADVAVVAGLALAAGAAIAVTRKRK